MNNIINDDLLDWVSSNGFPDEELSASDDIEMTVVVSAEETNFDF